MKLFLRLLVIFISSFGFSIKSEQSSYESLRAAIIASSLREVQTYVEKHGTTEIIEYREELARLAKEVKKINKHKLLVDFSRLKKRSFPLVIVGLASTGGLCGMLNVGFALNAYMDPQFGPRSLVLKLMGVSTFAAISLLSLARYVHNRKIAFKSQKKNFFDSSEIENIINLSCDL